MSIKHMICLAWYLASAVINISADPTYVWTYGLRGNPNRFSLRKIDEICGMGGVKPLSFERGDAIPEELSQRISPERIAQRHVIWRWFWKLHREYVLLRAVRGSALGQKQEVQLLEDMMKREGIEAKNTVLIGHSNGAAIDCNAMQTNTFKGAVLFTPPCHGGLAFRDFPPVCSIPRTSFYERWIVPFLRRIAVPLYKESGLQPIHLVAKDTNTDTPILIVSVKDDPKVKQFHQIALYLSLREAGRRVYFHEVEHGDHEYIMTEEQRKQYVEEYNNLKNIVQGFIKHINDPAAMPAGLVTQRESSEFLTGMYSRFCSLYGKPYKLFEDMYRPK